MIKHENIEELAQNFIKALRDATKNAKTEKDYEDLENIAVDTICAIPVILVQRDFWTRQEIKNRLPKNYQSDTDAINHIMYGLYSQDTIQIYCDDAFIERLDSDIDDTIKIIENVRGKANDTETN